MTPTRLSPSFVLAGAVALASVCGGCRNDAPVPQTQAAIDNDQIDFGKITLGATVTHVYTIHNVGDSVLRLANPRRAPGSDNYEVNCRLSKREVPPGGSANARLEIRPLATTRKLLAGVFIDSNAGELRLGGHLTVENLLEFVPDDVWGFQTLSNGEFAEFQGTLHSAGKRFRVASARGDRPALEVTTAPLEKSKLKKLQAKSGYAIKLRVKGLTEVGRFTGRVTVETDIDGGRKKSVKVTGTRWGPVQVLPRGTGWDAPTATLDLGRFSAKRGKTEQMFLVVPARERGKPVDKFRAATDASLLRVSVKRDAKRSTATQNWLLLTLAVPAGRPPVVRGRDNPMQVTVFTNHPRATAIRFHVKSFSY
ncbi:MAG: hypothetical protein ACE5KM_08685 [Planctomycetaceae bacterium]